MTPREIILWNRRLSAINCEETSAASFSLWVKNMFCPKCKSEYREGFYKCSDCGADLVAEQPPELMEEVSYVDFVEVFSTYQQSDIAFLKSVMDEEGITYFFQGESSIMMIAAGSYARLLVKADEASLAKEILQDLGFIEKA